MSAEPPYVLPEQLCVGLYIHLDLSWMDHPFAFDNFKIRTQAQIDRIRSLGLARIRIDPARSDCDPLPPPRREAAPAPREVVAVPDPALLAELAEKRRRIEEIARLRNEIDRVERQFLRAAESMRKINRECYGNPEGALAEAEAVIGQLVQTALSDDDVKVHAINQQLGDDVYFHALNVSMLAMILGRAIHLKADELQVLGMGALFHDIGLIEVPGAILGKSEPLSRAEQALYELHTQHGLKIGRRMRLPAAVQTVIAQHHERADGSGYPAGLSGHQISLPARIVALANAYDNLCNPPRAPSGLTPAEAIALLFKQQREHFDDSLLRLLIRCLGVFPPGSVVELTDQRFAMVLSVNPLQAIRPALMLYDPEVPKEAALLLDLATAPESLKIKRALRPNQVPRDVLLYLNPRARVTYAIDRKGGSGG